jgi:hypothetical protein
MNPPIRSQICSIDNNVNNLTTTRHNMTSVVGRDAETKIITISLPKQLLREIDTKRGVESRSSFIRRAAKNQLK